LMSGIHPKADIDGRDWDVRFVPLGDIAHLFDDLVCQRKKGRRNLDVN